MDEITVRVEELQPYDEFWARGTYFYTVAGKPVTITREIGDDVLDIVAVPVQHADGGYDLRHFDPGTEIEVRRFVR